MSDGFVLFRDTVTGKVERYPEHFEDRFPTLERVDSSEAGCLDCLLAPEPEPQVVPDEWDGEIEYDETEEDD